MRVSDTLCRFFLDPPDLSPAIASPNPTLWVTVKTEAECHGVAPLLASVVRNHLTGSERKWCDEVLTRSWRAHDRILTQLQAINNLLQSEGIYCMALKGPVLACRHYSPPFLRRPSGDLDLAVRDEDLERVCQLVMTQGYTMHSSIRSARRFSYHVVLENPGLPAVELHFRLSGGVSGIPIAELFDRSTVYEIPGGGRILIPSQADELMHLVLHLVKDRFFSLFHLLELRRIWASAPHECRDEAIERAADYGFSGVFRLADVAFQSRWGEPLLPTPCALPPTWLGWRINENLYRRMESNSYPRQDRTLASRLRGRLADLQVTDSPGKASTIALSAVVAAVSQWENIIRRRVQAANAP